MCTTGIDFDFLVSSHNVHFIEALKRRCGGDPCDTATCELYPQATCRVEERCGECLPVFSIGDQRVSCLQGQLGSVKTSFCNCMICIMY